MEESVGSYVGDLMWLKVKDVVYTNLGLSGFFHFQGEIWKPAF